MMKQIMHLIREYRAFLLVMIGYIIVTRLLFGRICPVQITTGFPCPGCGMVHAAIYLGTFQFEKAFQENAMVFLWVPVIAGLVLYWICTKKMFKGAKVLICFVGILTILYYIYRMTTMYPKYPMDPYTENLIHRILNWGKSI
jgi:hypothetical protein